MVLAPALVAAELATEVVVVRGPGNQVASLGVAVGMGLSHHSRLLGLLTLLSHE